MTWEAHAPLGLTDKQWVLAARICRKYYRQVGEAPEVVADAVSYQAHANGCSWLSCGGGRS